MMKNRNYFNKYYILGIAFFALVLLVFVKGAVDAQGKNNSKGTITISNLTAKPKVMAERTNGDINLLGFHNDPFFDTQWYIDNPGQYSDLSEVMKSIKPSTEGVDMDVIDAWQTMAEANAADNEVIVAVIDTGVDYQHPDLADNMWINEGEIPGDNIDNDNNGYVDDVYGWDFYNNDNTVCHYKYNERYKKYMASPEDNDNHGTHVAGIIAAVADNNMGIAGVASNINIKIMPLKINGGENGDGDIASAIEAVKYATMMGADICNMSWGTQTYSAELEEVMRESDMLFVAAAGNTGADNDKKPMYPASFHLDNLISVTFINADGQMTDYSNYGATSVDLAAPGDDIYSTIVGSYESMSGSSMAAPQVTAVAAMLYAYNNHLYASNVKDIITSNIKKLHSLDKYMLYGGIPSAYNAVMAANNLTQDVQAPVMAFDTMFNKGEMTVKVHVEDAGASKIRVVKWIYGEKTVEDFQHGMNGTTVEDDKVDLSKAGTYTFYASDYAGNETARTYKVIEDTTAPKLSAAFTIAKDYNTRTITVNANDMQSGLKRVKYLAGVRKAEDFLPTDAGKEIVLRDGKGRFQVKRDGTYTIFAVDNRGNMMILPITIKTVKATDFKLNYNEKTVNVGEKITLRTIIKPVGCTDRITYTSSDDAIAMVSTTGKVTAMTEGKVYITATTASGLKSTCVITVQLRRSS
ncbi:MAG TPA: S8 family serine peptidase [Mobilitalea sp.]|nr:S8 family serine peptidase [Mobilitalea sp.]